jgi:hypothetical protein
VYNLRSGHLHFKAGRRLDLIWFGVAEGAGALVSGRVGQSASPQRVSIHISPASTTYLVLRPNSSPLQMK